MDRQLAISLAVGAPILFGAVSGAWLPAPSREVPAQATAPTSAPTAALEFCHRAADMLQEVTWAAVCNAREEDNDCMLPESQAARLNALLDAETSRCLEVETQQPASR